MKIPLLMTVLLVACGPIKIGTGSGNVLCTTSAGVQLIGDEMPKDWTCEKLERTEAVTLYAVQRLVVPHDGRFIFAKEALKGTRLHVMPTPFWTDEYGRAVTGLTYCGFATICVGNPRPAWGAFSHEMMHAIQRCEPNGPIDPKDPGHSNWQRDGILAAEEDAWRHDE